MFKIYDSDGNYLLEIDYARETKVTKDLKKGGQYMEFQAPCKDEFIYALMEENYVESIDYRYCIKEIDMKGNDFFTVYCIPDYEEITGLIFQHFDGYQLNVRQMYERTISQADGWTVDYHSSNNTVIDLQIAGKTGMELIRMLQEEFSQEVWFDTKNKVLEVYDKMGTDVGTYYSNQLRIKQLTKQSDTYEFATCLYPYGKDGLTIEDINDGKAYLTNYTYCNKYIEKIWETDYEHAEDLKKAAEEYLEELSQPRASYRVQLAGLGDVGLGDQIFLVDKLKRIKQKQRVVKIVRYPYEPERDSVDISNIQESFTEAFLKQKKKMEADVEYIKKVLESM